jgi:hypothetical protein
VPMRSELAIPTMRAAWQKRPAESAWHQASKILRSSDLIVVAAMSAIGLSASILAAVFYPSLLTVVAF